jgi:hypothetical protein
LSQQGSAGRCEQHWCYRRVKGQTMGQTMCSEN